VRQFSLIEDDPKHVEVIVNENEVVEEMAEFLIIG
jgi:hypothetical protein